MDVIAMDYPPTVQVMLGASGRRAQEDVALDNSSSRSQRAVNKGSVLSRELKNGH